LALLLAEQIEGWGFLFGSGQAFEVREIILLV